MVSYIKTFFSYLFSNNSIQEYDNDMENYLSDELLKLDLDVKDDSTDTPEVPRTGCLQRTGVITYISEDSNYVLIDGMFYYDTTACSLKLKINDKITYLCYKNSQESLVVVRILQNQGEHWGDFDIDVQESSYNVIEHVIIGEVESREGRMVIINDSDLKFSLDNVVGTFVPLQGDFLELMCKVKYDEDNPMDSAHNNVVEVISFRPLRTKLLSTVITKWSGEDGICNKQIYFNKHCVINGGEPHVGAKCLIEALESNQGNCLWRVLKMDITEHANGIVITPEMDESEETSLEKERLHNIEITYPICFENVNFDDSPQIKLAITNKNDQPITMYRWILIGKKRDSQISITPYLNKSTRLYPNKTFYLTITCRPRFYGRSQEQMVIKFQGFMVERLIRINILGYVISTNPTNSYKKKNGFGDMTEMLKRIRNGNHYSHVPGVRINKSPNFIAVRIGQYSIPDIVWSAVLGNNYEDNYNHNETLRRIESRLPCLLQNLNVTNYMDRWHTLLYLEEIQVIINMKMFNMTSAFLVKYQEYLSLEVKNLAERRPSIIIGDKVVVKDMWDDQAAAYEGFVHAIRGDLLLLKFHPRFHANYRGSDVSVEFYHNRSQIRKSHHAINLALYTLGPLVLFPSCVISQRPQIPLEKLNTIKWFNPILNRCQKEAVTNILIGECRPMPYCIYGPPGTGKTVTVVETLLQILTLIPDSRILVATPSNSAANLITERLLKYRKLFSSSIIRLIAHYLVGSETIPDILKPYCATLNIATENTLRSTQMVQDGINMNVPASYVGRYRVTIGTCHCLGTLTQMNIPKGHFTHVIVDEAGHALEPEIMIPMTFVNKESGQIILAGDPMQLGPVVISKYCVEYGMDISYLSRMLESFPYQKDFTAFENGFNNKLVTQLTDNYRSLPEVLTLPSAMFYDASLVAKIDRNTPFILRILDVVSEIFEMPDNKTGGVFVHGVKGNNTRAVDSPSWYNPEEASMIALTLCKLYKKNITPDEIGIITPYLAQTKHLRCLLDNMNLERPKIGTVEEFQGQERPLIIISTVRSTQALVSEDEKHSLGFLRNPKRLNVGMTRAQVAVILFCDPELLRIDPLWNRVLNHAIKENKYMGCDFTRVTNETNEQIDSE